MNITTNSKIIHQWFRKYVSTSKQYENISLKDIIQFTRGIEQRDSTMVKLFWAREYHLNVYASKIIHDTVYKLCLYDLMRKYSNDAFDMSNLTSQYILYAMENNIFLDRVDNLIFFDLYDIWDTHDYVNLELLLPLDIGDNGSISPQVARERICLHIKYNNVKLIKMFMEHGNKRPWGDMSLYHFADTAKDYHHYDLCTYFETFENPSESKNQKLLENIVYYKMPENTIKKRKRSQ